MLNLGAVGNGLMEIAPRSSTFCLYHAICDSAQLGVFICDIREILFISSAKSAGFFLQPQVCVCFFLCPILLQNGQRSC